MDLEAIMTQMNDKVRSDMNAANTVIYQSLVEEKSAITNKMPESIFVNYFLPFFLNERNDNPQWMIQWVGIAGSSGSEVNIIDDVTKQHLFFVPAIFNSDQIRINNTEGTSYQNLFTRYNMMTNNLPQQGIRYLVGELSKKLDTLGLQGLNPTETNFHRQWQYILQRYNRIPKPDQQNSTDSADTNIADMMQF